MKTLELADGSAIPLVDVQRLRTIPHFWSRDKYYVEIEMRDGATKDVREHLSLSAARNKEAEISELMDQAWAEFDAYEYGYHAGEAAGRSEGRASGFAEGQSDGYRSGHVSGHEECRRAMLSCMFEKREAYACELAYDRDLPPSRRRFLRSAITVLTDMIERFSAEPA